MVVGLEPVTNAECRERLRVLLNAARAPVSHTVDSLFGTGATLTKPMCALFFEEYKKQRAKLLVPFEDVAAELLSHLDGLHSTAAGRSSEARDAKATLREQMNVEALASKLTAEKATLK